MDFLPIGSSSSGNCYVLRSGDSAVMIEAGLHWRRIQEALSFNTRDIAFCLVSHSHGDHAGHIKSVMRAGIDCWMSKETADALKVRNHRTFYVADCGMTYHSHMGNPDDWSVKPFACIHDVPCFGFLIAKDGEKALYLSDSMYSRYRFGPGLTHVFLEVNYSKETLSPDLDRERYKRLLKNHMNLSTAKALLAANDLSQVREIWLLHLSRENADAAYFRTEIEKLTGKPTYVAGE